MSTADQRAIITFDHNEIATLLENSLQRAYKLAEHLPDEQRDELRENIKEAYNGASSLSQLLTKSEAVLRQAEQFVDNAATVADESRKQRDSAMEELTKLINDIKNMNVSNPNINELYHQIERSHEHSFWMSLPFQIRRTCGDNWTHDDGLIMRQLLTIDLEEFDYDDPDNDWVEDEFGFTEQALKEARRDMLKIVRKLQGKSA